MAMRLHELQGQDIDATPHLKEWFERMGNRPAVQCAYAIGADIAATPGQISEEAKGLLYTDTRDHSPARAD